MLGNAVLKRKASAVMDNNNSNKKPRYNPRYNNNNNHSGSTLQSMLLSPINVPPVFTGRVPLLPIGFASNAQNSTVFSHLRANQRAHTLRLGQIYRKRLVGKDPSDTGLGKTWCAFGVAEQLHQVWQLGPNQKVRIAVVCPNNIVPEWVKLAKQFEHVFEILMVVNYEKLVRGRWIPWTILRQLDEQMLQQYDLNDGEENSISFVTHNTRGSLQSQPCPYLSRNDIIPNAADVDAATLTNDHYTSNIDRDYDSTNSQVGGSSTNNSNNNNNNIVADIEKLLASSFRERPPTTRNSSTKNSKNNTAAPRRPTKKTTQNCSYVNNTNNNSHNNSHNNYNNNYNNDHTVMEDEEVQAEAAKALTEYIWHLPKNTLLIFDEAHRCRQDGSCFNALLSSAIEAYKKMPLDQCRVRIHQVTASMLENPKTGLTNLLYLLQLIPEKSVALAKRLLNMQPLRSQLTKREPGMKRPFTSTEIDLRVIHYLLYNSPSPVASRMTNELTVKSDIQCVAVEKPSSAAHSIQWCLQYAQQNKRNPSNPSTNNSNINNNNNYSSTNPLAAMQHELKITEYGLLNAIADDAVDDYESGYNVCVFVNFRASVAYLQKAIESKLRQSKRFRREQLNRFQSNNSNNNNNNNNRNQQRIVYEDLPLISMIYGKQTDSERNYHISLFQQDRTAMLIGTIKAAGTSLSFHDTIGVHPKSTKISPPLSASALLQCLGRVHRENSKTDSKQRILFQKGTVSEHIIHLLNWKFSSRDVFNTGLLSQKTVTIFEWAQQIENDYQIAAQVVNAAAAR
jgi:hypothetical protein